MIGRSEGYEHHRREEIIPHVPTSASVVLDLGCAAGAFGRALMAARPGVQVDGLEIDRRSAAEAALTYEHVVVGSFPERKPPRSYDAIVCNDVLEHLVDPWAAVAALRDYLNPGGVVVASIPNMRYWKVLQPLLRGRWDYTDEGVLDRTHLRWFTKATMRELFTGAGYEIVSIERISGMPMRPRWKLAHLVLPALVDDVLTMQYVLVAR